MTILSSRKVPAGIQGLTVMLIGIGVSYLAIFIGYITAALGENASGYGVTPSNLTNYLFTDVIGYLIPAVFALSASYALFSQKKFGRMMVILYSYSSLTAFQTIVSGHPFFLFGVIGVLALYHMWQPRVKAYFQFL